MDRLRALGYLEYDEEVPEPSGEGVTFLDPDLAQPGHTLVVYAGSCRCDLITLEGRLVRTWAESSCRRWEHAVLTDTGDLIVVGTDAAGDADAAERIAGRYLLRMDWHGAEVWRRRIPVHHYVELTSGGRLLTLMFERRSLPAVHPEIDCIDGVIAEVSSDGEVIEALSIYDIVSRSARRFPLRAEDAGIDDDCCIELFHSNAIKQVPCRDPSGANPICAAGNVIVTSRSQDAVMVINLSRRELVWFWGQGELSGPHDGTVLPDGRLLIFDNGLARRQSSIVELDLSKREALRYRPPGESQFFTRVMGASQRLPNGNTLITHSDGCLGLELTSSGARAWAYAGIARSPSGRRAKVARMTRIPDSEVEALLALHR